MIEGTVLEHEDDHVLDLVESRYRVVDRDLDETARRLGAASEQGPE